MSLAMPGTISSYFLRTEGGGSGPENKPNINSAFSPHTSERVDRSASSSDSCCFEDSAPSGDSLSVILLKREHRATLLEFALRHRRNHFFGVGWTFREAVSSVDELALLRLLGNTDESPDSALTGFLESVSQTPLWSFETPQEFGEIGRSVSERKEPKSP
jgi:hypothetical protein